MIGYLKGVISHLFVNSCFIDVHGVGYRAYAPASTLDTLCVGQEAMLYTYMSVREDAIVLYGFATQDEYDLFMLLIGVNGVGPKVALGILSAGTADSFRLAVHQKDIKGLTKMPGIGKKTAERLLVELKDKVGVFASGEMEIPSVSAAEPDEGVSGEAARALMALGYEAEEIAPVLKRLAGEYDNVSQLVGAALREFGKSRG